MTSRSEKTGAGTVDRSRQNRGAQVRGRLFKRKRKERRDPAHRRLSNSLFGYLLRAQDLAQMFLGAE